MATSEVWIGTYYETSVAIVKDGRKIISNVVATSLTFHKKYGGIIPEIAFRAQLETIAQVADAAVKEAGVPLSKIGLICATNGPGLLGSLLVGVTFAKSLSYSLRLPLLGVDHLHSHLYSGFLNETPVRFPFIGLVVSGGHTSLYYIKDFNAITLLGSTQDDACGEAFDKVAKLLGLGYPGGPLIEKAAQKGDSKAIKFSCSGTEKPLNFSFSGIKTAVLYYVRKHESLSHWGTSSRVADVAASFQETVIDTLINKAFLACRMKKINRLVIGGGVVANNRLREKFDNAAEVSRVKVRFCAKALCTDNAAMVAGLGYVLFRKGVRSDLKLNAW